jgi:hypothetical protein
LYINNPTRSKNEWATFDAFSPPPPLQQNNSDAAYLADASSLMSSDESDSRSADFVDFNIPWRKKKTLLERIKDNEELIPPVSAAAGCRKL